MRATANLRTRITLLVAGAGLSAAALAGVGLDAAFGRQVDAAVDSGQAARTADIAAARARGDSAPLDADPFAQVLGADAVVLARSPGAPDSAVVPAEVLRGAGKDSQVIERDVARLGGPARLRLTPVAGGTLVVGTGLHDFREVNDRILVVLLAALGALLVLLVGGSWLLVGAALRPVGRMIRAAEAIGGEAGHERLPAPAGSDEIALLGQTLNGMLDRIDAAMRRERQFLDDASHELRTPLTVLRGELELAVDEDEPAVVRAGLRAALEEAERLSLLAEDLLVLARQRGSESSLRREGVDLTAWLQATCPGLSVVANPPLEVEVAGPADGASAAIDRDAVQRVLLNLATNAARAGARRLRISVVAEKSDVVVLVDDDGPGFPEDLLPRAFERFSRADRARGRDVARGASSTGLGLAIVQALVTGHGGRVEVANGSPLGGARVRIVLPRMRSA